MLGPSVHTDSFTRDNLPAEGDMPVFRLERPEFHYPEFVNAGIELLDAMIEKGFGDRPAVASPHEGYSYNQLRDAANRIARILVDDMGLVPGNRVLIRGANNPRFVASWFGVIRAGGVAVATMPLLRAAELAKVARKSRCTHALCDIRLSDAMKECAEKCPDLKHIGWFDGSGAGAGPIEARMAEIDGAFEPVVTGRDDVALLGFTSGTTGEPKATMHFHRDLLAICDSYAAHVLSPVPEDVFMGSPPIAFTFGLGGLVAFPLRFGASAMLLEDARPPQLLEAIGKYRPTLLFTAPLAYKAMADMIGREPGAHDLSSLRLCVSAGETLPLATYQAWAEAAGVPLLDGIGATEMLHIFISAGAEDVRPGATGKPMPGYEARIVDENMKDLPAGTVGRLAIRGPTGCRYLDDPRQRDYVRDGWNLTGDAFLRDEDGYFWFSARTDDMIISAGYNIAGPEVEDALLGHSAVAECAVVGVPDAERGEIVAAHVVLHDPAQGGEAMARELQDHVKAVIAPYKYPRRITFVESLPKTETGKIQRFRLRERAGTGRD